MQINEAASTFKERKGKERGKERARRGIKCFSECICEEVNLCYLDAT